MSYFQLLSCLTVLTKLTSICSAREKSSSEKCVIASYTLEMFCIIHSHIHDTMTNSNMEGVNIHKYEEYDQFAT